MRNFDAAIVAELAQEVTASFWLVELQLAGDDYYYTNCDIDLVAGGNTYQHIPLEIKEMRQAAGFNIDRVTVEFANVDLAFSSLLLNADAANKTVILSYVLMGSAVIAGGDEDVQSGDVSIQDGDVTIPLPVAASGAQIIDAPVEFFRGVITDWTMSEQRAAINLATEFMLWRKKALRLPTPSCPWSFKGTECAYASTATWCDKSVERCKALSNYDNFGGRRYIAAIEDQKIYWAPS